MWEVGLAHVMRLPDEVILVRSDHDKSIFDLTQFRAFQYQPDDVPQAREFLAMIARDRLRSIDQAKSNYVRRYADRLDPHSMEYLLNAVPFDGRSFDIPISILNATMVPRLFEYGVLRAAEHEMVMNHEERKAPVRTKYAITEFGKAVVKYLVQRALPKLPPEMMAKVSEYLTQKLN